MVVVALLFTGSVPAAFALPPVTITNATYRTAESPDDLTVNATWDVSAVGPGPHTVSVPLSGANVATITLDGTPAFPEALPAGGFSLDLSAGIRRIEATLVVPVRRTGNEREIRFEGPDVPRGTLAFSAAPGTTAVSVSSRRGRQTPDGAVTRADLGEGRSVVVRWRPARADRTPPPPEPTRELTTYDVSDGRVVTVTTLVFPASRQGPTYRIRKPEGWGIDRVTVTDTDTKATVPADALTDGDGILTITSRGPIDGRVTIHVALSPNFPPPTTLTLPIVTATEAPDPHALFAVRLDGIIATRWTRVGAIDWPVDAVGSFLGDVGLDAAIPIAFAARCIGGQVRLTIAVSPPSDDPTVSQRVTWTVGRRADVIADVTLRGSGATVILPIPPRIHDIKIRGAELLNGRREDGAFQLVRPPDDGAVRWAGSLGSLGPGPHSLPVPGRSGPVTVHIRPAPGWLVRVSPAPGVTPVANEPDAYRLDAGVRDIPVEVATEEPSAVPPPVVKPVPELPAAGPPSVAPPEMTAAPATTGHPFALAAWLAGLGALAAVGRSGNGRFCPECVAGVGILGWVAIGPGFVVLVVAGLVHRLARTVVSG